jgi:hypothetical protein
VRFKRLAAATAAAIATLAFNAPAAHANHSWGGYHWARTANPFTIKLGDNLGSTWKSYLSTASSDWSTSAVLDTTVVTGQSNSRRREPWGNAHGCGGVGLGRKGVRELAYPWR